MRTEFEMTDEEYTAIMDASKPTIVMKIGDYVAPSPQQNANAAWAELGRKLGFIHMTVRPIPGKSHRFFTAEATQ